MTPEEAAIIRKLIEETNALPRAEMPNRLSLMANPALLATSEIKSPQQYDQDMRRKHFLDKLSKEFPNPNYLPHQLAGPLSKYNHGRMSDLDSPYQYNGVFQGRAPLAKAFQWWASMPAMALNTSRLAANAIDPAQKRYPDAGKNLAKAVNTLTVYGAEDYGLVPKGTGTVADDFANESYARGQVPWMALDRSEPFGEIRESTQANIDRAIPSSYQHLAEAGIPENVAMPWGAMMDMMMDPHPGFVGAASRARRGLPYGRELAREVGLGMGPSSAPPAVDAARRGYGALRDLLSEEAFAGDGR